MNHKLLKRNEGSQQISLSFLKIIKLDNHNVIKIIRHHFVRKAFMKSSKTLFRAGVCIDPSEEGWDPIKLTSQLCFYHLDHFVWTLDMSGVRIWPRDAGGETNGQRPRGEALIPLPLLSGWIKVINIPPAREYLSVKTLLMSPIFTWLFLQDKYSIRVAHSKGGEFLSNIESFLA